MQRKSNTIFRLKPPSWFFPAVFHFSIPFLLIIAFFGIIFWIQALILSAFFVLILYRLFFRLLNNTFQGKVLKGHSPWIDLAFLEQAVPKIKVKAVKHPAPFMYGFDFYGQKKVILSSAFLEHFTPAEKRQALLFQKNYFLSNYAWLFTQLSCALFIFFFPIHYIGLCFQKLRFSFLKKIVERGFLYFIAGPFRLFTRRLYFQMDRSTPRPHDHIDLMKKIHARFTAFSPESPPLFIHPLFFTNPLTKTSSCFSLQPQPVQRIQNLEKFF